MATPATYTSRMVNLLAPGGAEVEGDHVVAIPVLLGDAGRHLDRHAEAELRRIGLDVDQVAAHRHALGQIDDADHVGTGTPGMDWCTIDHTQTVPLRDSGISSNCPSAVHR